MSNRWTLVETLINDARVRADMGAWLGANYTLKVGGDIIHYWVGLNPRTNNLRVLCTDSMRFLDSDEQAQTLELLYEKAHEIENGISIEEFTTMLSGLCSDSRISVDLVAQVFSHLAMFPSNIIGYCGVCHSFITDGEEDQCPHCENQQYIPVKPKGA